MGLAGLPFFAQRIEALRKGREAFIRKKARKARLREELAVPPAEVREPEPHGKTEVEPGIGSTCRPVKGYKGHVPLVSGGVKIRARRYD